MSIKVFANNEKNYKVSSISKIYRVTLRVLGSTGIFKLWPKKFPVKFN